MRHLSISIALLVLLVSACAPGASVLAPPTFSLIAGESGLVRLEPPGVGSGAAVFRLELEARNPNPVAIQIAGLDGDFSLSDRRVAGSRFTQGISLPANGTGRVTLDVEAPLAEAPHLVNQLARLLGGSALPFRLDGTLSLNVFGSAQRFPSVTIVQGELQPPGPIVLPEVRFDPSATRLTLDGLQARIEVGLEISNPTFLGFQARGPELLLLLDGRAVGRASMPPTPVPAMGTTTAVLRAEAGLPELGAGLFTRIQGGVGGLQVALDGDLAFEIPGVISTAVPLSRLGGTLR